MGRLKVRQIFTCPPHAERLIREVDGSARAAITVRSANRDEVTGLIALVRGTTAAQVEDKL